MKLLLGVLIMVITSTTGAADSAGTRATNAKAPAVFKRLEQFYRDMRAEKIDEAMTLYESDAEVILPGQNSISGSTAIRNWWAATLLDYEFQVKPEFEEATDVGNAIVLRGRALGQLVSRTGGSSVVVDSWFMQIYRRQPNGTYLFWRGASGPNPPKSGA